MSAGQGFKTFATGDVLTASDVNGYLMQGIWVFASTAARDAAVTAPAEGNFAFTKDTNSLWYYDGAAWVASGATGDIEGVTAGIGISGGGTSGTVTVTNSMATAIDAKGDLVVGTGADTFSRLAAGTNTYILTADSTQATGLKWAAPSGGGGDFVKITSGSFSAQSSVSINGVFTSTYTTYMAIIESDGSVNGADLQSQFTYAGPTTETAGYYGAGQKYKYDDTLSGYGFQNAAQATIDNNLNPSSFGTYTIYFKNVGNSSEYASYYGFGMSDDAKATLLFTNWQVTARNYTGFLLKPSSGNITGTYAIYGLAN